MKTIILILLPFLCSAQVVIPEIQRNISNHETSYAITGGIVATNESTFTAGPVLKLYGRHIKPGIRIQVQIPINELLAFQAVSDAFLQKNTDYYSRFLEIGAGLALTVKGFQTSAIYQMADYNPIKHKLYQDCVVIKVGYQIRWDR